MPPVPTDAPETIADLLERLGGVPADRVRLRPPPGQATEQDVLAAHDRDHRLCELVDGALVEKAMGFRESNLAVWLGHLLYAFIAEHNLGELTGPDGPLRLMPGLVRMPDVGFIRRGRMPAGQERIPDLFPDLAVEILSKSNTAGEIGRKLKEYFLAGTTLVWLVDPRTRQVVAHTAPDRSQTLTESDALDGGSVLPGLLLPVRRVFERLPAAAPPPAGPRKKKRGA